MRVRGERKFQAVERALFLSGPTVPGAPADRNAGSGLDAAAAAAGPLSEADSERLALLREITRARGEGRTDREREARYAGRFGVCGVKRYDTPSGIRIYRLSVEAFPSHFTHTYLVLAGETTLLVDTGTVYHVCEKDFGRGMEVVRGYFGERVRETDIADVLVTHGHIDHFGRVGALKERIGCRIHIHRLDAGILSEFETRIDEACQKIRLLVVRSGVDPSEQDSMLDMYLGSKAFYQNIEVDEQLEDGDRLLGRWPVIHVPGHCPGEVCLLVDGCLLVGDHVLSDISPHQAPNYIFPNMGLRNYIASLGKVRRVDGVRLVLPGHQREIVDLGHRVEEILAHHAARLDEIVRFCDRERTLWEIAGRLFGDLAGYNRLLGMEEAAAHVEYLLEERRLRLVNPEGASSETPAVLRFVTRQAAQAVGGGTT